MTALGQSTESYGALLVHMVLGKLPVDVRKSLAREHSHLEWTLDQLRQSIAKEIRILEAGAFIHCPNLKISTEPPHLFSLGPQIGLILRNH